MKTVDQSKINNVVDLLKTFTFRTTHRGRCLIDELAALALSLSYLYYTGEALITYFLLDILTNIYYIIDIYTV